MTVSGGGSPHPPLAAHLQFVRLTAIVCTGTATAGISGVVVETPRLVLLLRYVHKLSDIKPRYLLFKDTCITFKNGSWTHCHNLAIVRWWHVSWRQAGPLLLGGWSHGFKSTEIMTESGSTRQFNLPYGSE